MKFWKTTLAVVVGVLIASVISTVFLFSFLGNLTVGLESTTAIPSKGILKIDLSRCVVNEQSSEIDLAASAYSREEKISLGLWDVLKAIKAAEDDPRVEYIYLKTDGNSTDIATLKEIREAISEFRVRSGKAVISYIENPTTGSYYMASVADKVYMSPYSGGNATINGVSMQTMYLKDLLDILGVNFQLIRHGKYKSAGEALTRNSGSAENRQQYEALVNAMWGTLSGEIAQSRDISVEQLNKAIDNLELCLPEDFVQNRLVDDLLNRSQLEAKLTDIAVEEDFDDLHFFSLYDYISAAPAAKKSHNKTIAVIYADGEIVDGSGLDDVAGDHFASVIEDVRKDENVQAIVLRVNSPGGSVIAAEKIKAELDAVKGQKPLVASYGMYAASGGYWISANSDRIFCNPLCLTGSIGVFGLVPEFSKLYKDKLHITAESTSSNAHGDMYTLSRPFDAAEYKYIERSIERIYDQFTGLVAQGRGMSVEQVDEIAQGRVWAGTDAMNINLVDEFGGLQNALEYAAAQAGDPDLGNWNIQAYPEKLNPFEQIVQSLLYPEGQDFSILTGKKKLVKEMQNLKPSVQARLPFDVILQK